MSSFILATGGYDNNIRFFDATNQTMIRTIQFCDQQVLRLAFSGDGPVHADTPLYLVAGGSPSVAVYDVSTPHTSPTLFQVYQEHSEAVTAVGFEPRHTAFVFSASEDGTIQTWLPQVAPLPVAQPHHFANLTAPHALHPLAGGTTLENGDQRFPHVPQKMRNDGPNGMVPIHDAVYYPPKDLFFTADHDGRLCVWDHATSTRTAMLIPHPKRRNLQCLDLSSDYRLLVTANFDGFVFLYHVDVLLTNPSKAVPVSFRANPTYVPRVRLSVTINLLVCTTSSGVIKVFRIADVIRRGMSTRQKQQDGGNQEPSPDDSVTPIQEFTGHPGWIWDAAFVEDRDDYLFTCSSSTKVTLWPLDEIQARNEYAGHEKGVVCLAVRERMSAGINPDQFGSQHPAEQAEHLPPNGAATHTGAGTEPVAEHANHTGQVEPTSEQPMEPPPS